LLTATDITGPEDSKIGVVDLYDVLGFADETKQGADIVAEALNAVVIIPDVLKGMYAQPDWFPLDSDAKRQHFFGWLHGPAAAHKYLGILTEVMEECKTRFPSVTNWGSYGLCWGGKVT
jgi:cell wall assembly regulator SMI1